MANHRVMINGEEFDLVPVAKVNSAPQPVQAPKAPLNPDDAPICQGKFQLDGIWVDCGAKAVIRPAGVSKAKKNAAGYEVGNKPYSEFFGCPNFRHGCKGCYNKAIAKAQPVVEEYTTSNNGAVDPAEMPF